MMYPGAPQIMFDAPNDGGVNPDPNPNPNPDPAPKPTDPAPAPKNDPAPSNDKTDDEKRELLREVMDKKNKLKDAEAEKERLAAELKKYEGIDVDKVKALIEAEAAREAQELEAKGEWDRLKQMMADQHAAEKKTLEEQIEALRQSDSQKAKAIDELTVGQNFAMSTFIKDDLVLTPAKARQLYGAYFELKDGRTVGYDKPAGSENRTMLIDSAGNPLSFDEGLKKIIDSDPEKDTLLRAKIQPGANSKTVQNPTPGSDKSLEGVTGVNRLSALLAKKMKPAS
jgi:hypothetical protein